MNWEITNAEWREYQNRPPGAYSDRATVNRWIKERMQNQLEQLSDDEAVERVARYLYEEDQGEAMEEHQEWCERAECAFPAHYTRFARDIINALIGEDTP